MSITPLLTPHNNDNIETKQEETEFHLTSAATERGAELMEQKTNSNVSGPRYQTVNSQSNVNADKADYNMSNNLRSEKEIMDFLDHYMFKLSNIDVLNIYLLNPISIFLNVAFITYNMYKIFIIHDNDYNKNTESYLSVCEQIVTGFEFGGLCIVIITLLYTYIFLQKTENYATFMDLLELTGSWSAFKLFYKCRPTAIFAHISTVIKNNTNNYKDYCETLQQEIATVKQPVYDLQLKKQLRKALENQSKAQIKPKKRGLKQFMTESAYGLVILLLIIGLGIGILSLLLKLSQLNFITTKQIGDWSIVNWFYCFGFSNQLWNMVNIDQLKTFTIYELFYTNNRNISSLATIKKLQRILYLDGLIKTRLYTHYGWKGILISLHIKSSHILQILIKNPYQKEKPYTFEEYQQHNKILQDDEKEQDRLDKIYHDVSIQSIQSIHTDASSIELEDSLRSKPDSQESTSFIVSVMHKTTEVLKEENKKWKHVLNTYLSDLKLESLTIKDPISEAQLFVKETELSHLNDIKISNSFTNLSYWFETIQDWLEKLFIITIIMIMITCISTSILSLFTHHNLHEMDEICHSKFIWIALCITLILIITLFIAFVYHQLNPDNAKTDKFLRFNVILLAVSIIGTFFIFIFHDEKCVKNIENNSNYDIIHIAILTNLSLLIFLLLPIFIHILFHPFYIMTAILTIILSATLITDALFTFSLIAFVIQHYNAFRDIYQNHNNLDICDINLTVMAIIICYYAINILFCFMRMISNKPYKLSAPKGIKYLTFIVYIILITLLIYDDIYLNQTKCEFWSNNKTMYKLIKYSAGYNCIFWCITFIICLPANKLKDVDRIKQIGDFFMYHSASILSLIFIHLISDLSIFGLSLYILLKRMFVDITYHGISIIYDSVVFIVVIFIFHILFTIIRSSIDGYGKTKCLTFSVFMEAFVFIILEIIYFILIIITCLAKFGIINWLKNPFQNIQYDILIILIFIVLFGQFIGIFFYCFRKKRNKHWLKMINHITGTIQVCSCIFLSNKNIN